MPEAYLDVTPEVVFEVLSAGEWWGPIIAKVAEYFAAGVLLVVAVDSDRESACLFDHQSPPAVMRTRETLTLPGVLPGFEVPIARFFAE